MHYRRRDQTLTPRDRGRGNRRRIAGGFAVSLLLHAAVVLTLVLRLKWEPEEELLPPPATVNMVFEGGRPEGPSTPEPAPEPQPSTAPSAPVGAPPGEAPAPPPPPLSRPTPEPPPPEPVIRPPEPPRPPEPAPPEPPPPEPPPPEPAIPPVEPPRPPEPPSPTPPPPPPPPATPPTEPGPAEVTVPPPTPVSPPATPEPQPPPPRPVAPTPQRETWPPLRQAAPAQRQSDFPPPMNFSFGPPAAEPGMPTPGKPLLSLSLPRRGPDDSTPYSVDTDAEVGPDWRNALSEWVETHSYYPSQAAALGHQGTVRVLVKTMPDGRVLSVELERRSGSAWLDLALEGLFRGAKLPPMPKSVGDQPVPFHFTMHYIIVR